MDLEKVTAKIRPRRSWEAIDLGITFVQSHAATLYKIWFSVSLPIFIILLLIPNISSAMMIFVFWWLKPIMERPLLHFLSRKLFAENLTVKDCVKSFYSVAKIQWFASLTWRRLSFTRSFDLPLIQLEQLKSSARAKRLRVTHSGITGGAGSAVWLTIIFSIVEMLTYFSMIVLIYLFIPEVYAEEFDIFKWIMSETGSGPIEFIFNFITYLSVSLVAPFYVACGFSLYLNQRTHLEAWDIELAFKRLAEKMTKKSSNLNIRLASYTSIGLLLLITSSFNTQPVYSEEQAVTENTTVFDHAKAKKVIKSIKDGDDFHQIKKEESNRFISSSEKEEDKDEESNLNFSPIWLVIAKIFAVIIEFALWIFVIVLLIFLVMKYKHLLVSGLSNKKVIKKRPQKLFGLDLNSHSLPDKPWLVAQKLINEQRYREALSLLYRASLIWSIDNSDALIKEGYTELECYQQISKHVDLEIQKYFKQLTDNWRNLAYAHQIPNSDMLISLCETWSTVLNSAKTIEEKKAVKFET